MTLSITTEEDDSAVKAAKKKFSKDNDQ